MAFDFILFLENMAFDFFVQKSKAILSEHAKKKIHDIFSFFLFMFPFFPVVFFFSSINYL